MFQKNRRRFKSFFKGMAEVLFIPCLLVASLIAKKKRKPIQVGFGPYPMINSIYHKRALQRAGYTAELFVNRCNPTVNDFDIKGYEIFSNQFLISIYLFVRSLFKYEVVYLFFDGGPLGNTNFLWRFEPIFYRLAKTKTVLSCYGGDVLDFRQGTNLVSRHLICASYPKLHKNRKMIEKKVELWTRHASHVVAAGDLVDFLYHWDTLVPNHLAIDIDKFDEFNARHGNIPNSKKDRPLRIFHAPNHRACKGTEFFISAVKELRAEGYPVELVIREKVSNEEVKREIAECDLVADQLIIGWYGMFAVEAMAMGKPTICYIRPDLLDLFTISGCLKDSIPLISCTPRTVKDQIRVFLNNRDLLLDIGKKSREYVKNWHSLDHIGAFLGTINKSLDVLPR